MSKLTCPYCGSALCGGGPNYYKFTCGLDIEIRDGVWIEEPCEKSYQDIITGFTKQLRGESEHD